MLRALAMAALVATPGFADTLVAARTVRAQSLLGIEDLALVPGEVPGAFGRIEEAVGLEARIVLYAGRPIRPEDVGPAAIVERNQIVRLEFRSGSVTMTTEGRAMTRAGIGDTVRVINLSSRTTVTGTVARDGSIHVGPGAASIR